jgi:hypothetical protein
MEDLQWRQLEPLATVEHIEAHLTWSGLTAGFELYCESLGSRLATLDLTLLDHFSWHSIAAIGRFCPGLTRLHLTLWREDMTDLAALQLPPGPAPFAGLQDLKLKCELYVDFLPEDVFEFFLHHCRCLKTVQYIAPIDWIVHQVTHSLNVVCSPCAQDIVDLFSANPLADLEMLVLANSNTEAMNLGLQTVHLFLQMCPKLAVFGNLKTWRKIDFYDPNSDLYFKSESMFFQLKKEAIKKNWDIDFDIENLDSVYKESA